MNSLFQKPSGVRYVDMAIWIDNNFYKPDCDKDLAFKYMYLLAYMLASKAKYFNNYDDYDQFAFYLAQSTFQRMNNEKKVKLKSVLNYMKSIMYFRRAAYLRETFSQIIDPEFNIQWDPDRYTQQQISNFEANNSYLKQLSILDILNSLPAIIKQNIPKVYKNNKQIFHNLYLSVMLSFIARITLPTVNQKYMEQKNELGEQFNSENYYIKHSTPDEIIMWHLPDDEYSDIVKLILNKVKNSLIQEIAEAQKSFSVDPESFKNSLNDDFFSGSDDYGC